MNSKITFPELIELLATATGTSKRMSELFLKELFATVSQALIDGENVRIKNLGQFKLETVKSRKSVSVNTGQEVEIPSHNRLVFTPAKTLADALNEPFAHFETIVLSDELTDEQLAALDIDDPVVAIDTTQEVDSLELPQQAQDIDEKAEEESSTLETPPPFRLPITETVVEQEEPIIPPVTPPLLEISETQESEEEQAGQTDEELPVEQECGISIVEYEREKRHIARKSVIKGIVCGALGMLVLMLAGWGIYTLALTQPTTSVQSSSDTTCVHKEASKPQLDTTAVAPTPTDSTTDVITNKTK